MHSTDTQHLNSRVDPEEEPAGRWVSWRRLAHQPVEKLLAEFGHRMRRWIELLKIQPPETAEILRRIQIMERHIVLPIKVAGIAILVQSFYFTPWIRDQYSTLDVPVRIVGYFLWLYIGINVAAAGVLFAMRRLTPALVERSVFLASLVDGIFLGLLTVVTGGYNSGLYWVFLGLMVRSAVSVPRASSQLVLNLTLSTCFVVAGVIVSSIADKVDPQTQAYLEFSALSDDPQPILLRLALLLLMTFGCYVVQVLLERQRQAAEEAQEFAVREVRLRSAGRLAAEFTHQIKNPLAIINTAIFSLKRALRDGKGDAAEQIQMIQEEIEHADRIITQVMGYAQLTEGRVEKLDVLEELDHAIALVFPPAAHYPIQIYRDYGNNFPPLLMQRRHASECFTNILQNAREALEDHGGNLFITAHCHDGNNIEVSMQDDGPGIPAERRGRIFEAYYTTKKKGTGLGLATVKNNVELYGGSVRVESELGKGARFVLVFPARTLMKIAETSS
jgi:signal transduction histidine kinase